MENALCSICEKPNKVIRCRGKCKRFFHKDCANIHNSDDTNWYCGDCSKRVHRCFVCHEYAPDNQLLQCVHPGCHRFYHNSVECIGDYILDAEISTFECPSHTCSFCKKKEESSKPLIHCCRCTKSYHSSCAPSTLCPLNSQVFICIHHRFEDQPYPPLSMEILEQRVEEMESEELSKPMNSDAFYEQYYKSKTLHHMDDDDHSSKYFPV